MTGTATHRPLADPFSTGTSWLARALAVSIVLHAMVGTTWHLVSRPKREVELVDIELAPAAPKAEALPAEVAKVPEQTSAAATTEPEGPIEHELALVDAGIDAPIDAPGMKKPDAAVDAEVPLVAQSDDAAIGDAGEGDGATQVAMTDPGTGSAGVGSGSQDTPGVPGATEGSQGSGAPGMDNQPAVDGAPTSAGTAANLLAYFPAGHQITVL